MFAYNYSWVVVFAVVFVCYVAGEFAFAFVLAFVCDCVDAFVFAFFVLFLHLLLFLCLSLCLRLFLLFGPRTWNTLGMPRECWREALGSVRRAKWSPSDAMGALVCTCGLEGVLALHKSLGSHQLRFEIPAEHTV